ncbi:MAG TPA: gfo/Idh/MocA family oxidoreductase [Planctomycetaceae bacterium]|nr:dehydrogenase [Blastopirellula sp.]HAY80347.1 gfo/Idh/MocA family oxidoreductase [Planctomycetaceae bacterium]
MISLPEFTVSQTSVRFGLIGYGLFGAHHATAIAAAENAELVAITVKSEASRAAAQAAYPNVKIYADYEHMLATETLDIVDVVVPNALHHAVGTAVLEADCHLLMEKPMALTLQQCDTLIQLAEQKGKLIAVGHELRLSSLWAGAKTLIDEGKIGTPQHVLIELSRFPYRQGSEGWRYDIDRVGSWILEEPIHFFDLARWYLEACDEPLSVYARSNSRHADHPELKDNFTAIVNHRDGAYAVVSQTLAAFGHHQAAKITGTEGTIWCRWSAADARSDRPSFDLRYGLGDQLETVSLDKPAGELLELADEITAVANCVLHQAPPPCTGNDGRWSTLLCLVAEASIDQNAIVTVDDYVQSHS